MLFLARFESSSNPFASYNKSVFEAPSSTAPKKRVTKCSFLFSSFRSFLVDIVREPPSVPVSAPLSLSSQSSSSKPSVSQPSSTSAMPSSSAVPTAPSDGNLDPKMLDSLYKTPQFKPKTRSKGRFRSISRSKSRSKSRSRSYSRSHRHHRSRSHSRSRSRSHSRSSNSPSSDPSDLKGVSSQKSESSMPSNSVVRRMTQSEKKQKLASEKRRLKLELQQEMQTRKKRFAVDETPSNSTHVTEVEPVSVCSIRIP